MNKKELLQQLEELKDKLHYYKIDEEEGLREARRLAEEFDYETEYLFDEYISLEDAEELAKHELEEGWITRLYYFLGDFNPNYWIPRIDGYWNLENATSEDIEYIIDEVIKHIEEN